jgi:hypothetical protein
MNTALTIVSFVALLVLLIVFFVVSAWLSPGV